MPYISTSSTSTYNQSSYMKQTDCEWVLEWGDFGIFGDFDLVTNGSFLALTMCVMASFVCHWMNEGMVVNNCAFRTLRGHKLTMNGC